MDMDRLNDMLARYGEVCSQKTAGKILNVVPRTIFRMMEEVRLRRVAHGVDVRSICAYIEEPKGFDFKAGAVKTGTRTQLDESTSLTAALSGRWSPRR